MKPKKQPARNRAKLAEARGRRQVQFEVTQEFDELIERVRDVLAADLGTCTRVQALERMGREGARILLENNPDKKSQSVDR